MSNNKTVSGKCLCGSIEVNFTLDSNSFGACHCQTCRTWAGGPALAVQGGTDLKFSGEENITVFSSSPWGERGFCKICGTHIFFRLKSGNYINFPLGFLQNVDHLKFDMQIFIDQKPKHYNFAEKTLVMTEKEFVEKFTT